MLVCENKIIAVIACDPNRQVPRISYFLSPSGLGALLETFSEGEPPEGRRGGLPYEWGGVARCLAYGCKFRILVSLRVYIALVMLPE